MSAWSLLDGIVVGTIVLVCVTYAAYALSPVSVKRVLLSWLYKCVGARVFGWLSPNPGACDHCGGAPVKPRIKTK
jgi:hypothetical protein